MSKTTYDLTEKIKSAIGVEELKNYQKNNKSEMHKEPIQYLLDTATLHNIDKSTLIKNSGIERTRASHILSNDRTMTRDVCLAFAFAGKLTLDETNTLLKYASHNQLYARDKRDSVIIYTLNKSLTLMDTNSILYEFNLELLPKSRSKN